MSNSPDDARVVQLKETGSTNADAMRLAVGGEVLPLWVIAERQTAGRGRAGRSWASLQGNFAASIALQCDAPLDTAKQLSLVAGISLLDAIRATTPLAPNTQLRLKWPNDVLIGVAKAGGILVESTQSRGSPGYVAVIGFGVNLNTSPTDLGRAATALVRHGPATNANVPAPLDLLDALNRTLSTWVACWDGGKGFAAIREAWIKRAGPRGEAIMVSTTSGVVSGIYEGLAPTGALLASVDGVLREFNHGDVALVARENRDGQV